MVNALPYVNNPFILSRVDGSDASIDATRTASFIAAAKSAALQSAKSWPEVRGLPGGTSLGTPFVFGDTTDPIWKLVALTGYTPDPKAAFLGTTGFRASVDINDYLTATSTVDLLVFNRAGGFTVYVTKAKITGTNQITCQNWSVFYHNTNGLDYNNPLSDSTTNTSARGRLIDGMVIRRDLVDAAITAGTGLGHVLHMNIWNTDSNAGYCHPMTGYDLNKTGWGAEGERIRIKPSVNLAARGLSPMGLVIARTLQQHGAYIGDNAGGASNFRAQQDGTTIHPWAGLSTNIDMLSGITWDDFEVVTKGWQGTGAVPLSGAYVVQNATNKTGAGSSLTTALNVPATAGNTLVAVMAYDGLEANATIPAGYTQKGSDSHGTGCNLKVATKTATGGEVGATFTAGAGSKMIMVLYEITGNVGGPTLAHFQTPAPANSLTLGPDVPRGLELVAVSLGPDITGDTLGAFDSASSVTTDQQQKTTVASGNIALITGSLKQTDGSITPSVTWTGTAVQATGFIVNFSKTAVAPPPAGTPSHYRFISGNWTAQGRYIWNGTAWVAAVDQTQGQVPTTKRFVGDPGVGQVYVGESRSSGDPTDRETAWGATVGMYRSYFTNSQWGTNLGTLVAARAARDLAKGRLPWISFKDPGSWKDIANGVHDSILNDMMTRLGQVNGPVWLCMHHEPYDDTSATQGYAADYSNANKHLMALKPSNVAIVPILQSAPFDPTVFGSQNIAPWYAPGSYSIPGIDTYNHKYYVPAPGGNNYRDAATVMSFLDKMRSDLGLPNVPIAIAEFGVRTDPANPGKAAQWLRDMVALAKTKNCPALCYFDSNLNVNDGGTYWELDWNNDGTNGTERMNAYGPLVNNNAHLP